MTELLPGALADVGWMGEEGTDRVEEVRELSSDWISGGSETARDLDRQASEQFRSVWEPEDSDKILDESYLFEPLPVETDRAEPGLLSLRWRNEALPMLSSAGVLSLEYLIGQHTPALPRLGFDA